MSELSANSIDDVSYNLAYGIFDGDDHEPYFLHFLANLVKLEAENKSPQILEQNKLLTAILKQYMNKVGKTYLTHVLKCVLNIFFIIIIIFF